MFLSPPLLLILLFTLCTTAFSTPWSNTYTEWVQTNGGKYTKTKSLTQKKADKGPELVLHWTIENEKSVFKLAFAVKATGWVALGISETGGLLGSDLLIFEAAKGKVLDGHVKIATKVNIDHQQDWKLVNSIARDGMLIVEAERKLDTNDTMDWPIVDDSDVVFPGTKLLALWGDSKTMGNDNLDIKLQASLRFFGDPAMDDSTLFSNVMKQESQGTVTMKVHNFEVPTGAKGFIHDENRCFSVQKLIDEQQIPSDKPLHLIGFEWLPDAADLVQHIAIYSSTSAASKPCDEGGCKDLLHMWNKGQDTTFFFPPNVAMLLADESNRGGLGRVPKDFRLEIHYENPEKVTGTIDSSGVRLFYTSNLRQHTGAIMALADPRLVLRGTILGDGLQRHTFSCPDTCTKNHVPVQGLNVVYEMFHMHRTGLSMVNVHKREGKEIRRATIQFFNSEQEGAHIVKQQPFEILPGDSFETVCHYDGFKLLKFGFENKREVCQGWALYYPALDDYLTCSLNSKLDGCESTHLSAHLFKTSQLLRQFGEARKVTKVSSSRRDMVDKSNAAALRATFTSRSGASFKKGNSTLGEVSAPKSSSIGGKGSTKLLKNDHLQVNLLTLGVCFGFLATVFMSRRRSTSQGMKFKKVGHEDDEQTRVVNSNVIKTNGKKTRRRITDWRS